MKRLAWVSLPRAFTISLSSFVFVALSAIATTLPVGSVSLFTLSFNLQSVPLSVIGVSYAVALFPMISDSFARGMREEALVVFAKAYRHAIFWTLPAIGIFVILRSHIVRIILGSGAFSWENTRLAAASLAVFMIGLFAQVSITLFIRVFYADHNTKTPLVASLANVAVTITSALAGIAIYLHSPGFRTVFETILRVEHLKGAIMILLTLGYVLGSLVQVAILSRGAKKLFATTVFPNVKKALLHSTAGTIALGVSAYLSLQFFALFFTLETFGAVFLEAVLATLVGVAVYVGVLYMIKSTELSEMLSALHRKLKPVVILPDEIENA